MNDEWDEIEEGEDEAEALGPSRSQQKRDHKALRDLVRELVALPPRVLDTLPLEAGLRDQLVAAKQLVPKALNREVRYLTRQLVEADPDVLRAVIDRHNQPHRESVKALHTAERYRDALLGGDDAAMGDVFARHPEADRQQLRQLIRAGRKEREAGGAPKSARKLFKLLHALETARSGAD